MAQAITAHYMGATNFFGTRIEFRCLAGRRRFGYPHQARSWEDACVMLLPEFLAHVGLDPETAWLGGETVNGMLVFVPADTNLVHAPAGAKTEKTA